MKEQFCSYDISLKLKELGFDEECFGGFSVNGDLDFSKIFISHDGYCFDKSVKQIALAPLWQQVIDWFSEKHKIHIWISYQKEMDVKYFSHIVIENQTNKITTGYRDTADKAREQAILKAIELITSKQ